MTEREAALVLAGARGVGCRDAWALRARYGSFRGAVDAALAGRLPSGPAEAIRRSVDAGEFRASLEQARALGARYAVPGDGEYPVALGEIARPPVGLFVAGRRLDSMGPMLAVVGTRAATVRGAGVARDLAEDAAAAGLTVVSGLARGIDTAAHEGALAAGGRTVAVMGTGLKHVYPRENVGLAKKIVAEGALISELPLDQGPRAAAFPGRNRIIAGLSVGVVVVEAGARSGALITAGFALEAGREVLAVPGPVTEPLSRGPNGLIKAGARLVEDFGDVLDEIRPIVGESLRPPGEGERAALPSTEAASPACPGGLAGRVLAVLSTTPASVDELAGALGAPPGAVSAAVVELELSGAAASCPGGRYVRPSGRRARRRRE